MLTAFNFLSNVITLVSVSSLEEEIFNETSKLPAVKYEILGFCSLDVFGVPPSKVHYHEVGSLVEVSVNWIVSPAIMVVLSAVKCASILISGEEFSSEQLSVTMHVRVRSVNNSRIFIFQNIAFNALLNVVRFGILNIEFSCLFKRR